MLSRSAVLRALRAKALPSPPAVPPIRFLSIFPSLQQQEQSSSSTPWFVETPRDSPPHLPTASTSSTSPPLPTAVPLPSHVPTSLHALHSHLSSSPFLVPEAVTFIHARDADPDTWVDWVVLTTLRRGREGGLRGAVDGIKAFLIENPIDTSSSDPAAQPFSPPPTRPLVSGLPTSPSKHARARTQKSSLTASREDQASGWAMVDAGFVIVHVQTEDARENWGLEGLWEGIRREGARRN